MDQKDGQTGRHIPDQSVNLSADDPIPHHPQLLAAPLREAVRSPETIR
jgi:hypothetical protein